MVKWKVSLKDLYKKYGDFVLGARYSFETKEIVKKIEEEGIKNKVVDYKTDNYISIIKNKEGVLEAVPYFKIGARYVVFNRLVIFHAKQIKICYIKRTEDLILVIDIKNVLYYTEMPRWIWSRMRGGLYIDMEDSKTLRINKGENFDSYLCVGKFYTKEEFEERIRKIKKAGEIFSKLVKEFNEINLEIAPKPKCIKI